MPINRKKEEIYFNLIKDLREGPTQSDEYYMKLHKRFPSTYCYTQNPEDSEAYLDTKINYVVSALLCWAGTWDGQCAIDVNKDLHGDNDAKSSSSDDSSKQRKFF